MGAQGGCAWAHRGVRMGAHVAYMRMGAHVLL